MNPRLIILRNAARVCGKASASFCQASGHYSFWDYQAGAWNRNDGIRIDHMLLTPQAADLMTNCGIDAEIRGHDKPSDHVPVWVELDL